MPIGVYQRTPDMKTGKSAGSRGNHVHHGYARRDSQGRQSPTYVSWLGMIARCTKPNHNRYYRYGGRGIQICVKWIFFENFLTDMGERPLGTSLDRMDNDGNYEPGNCRWATPKEQCINRRTPIRRRKD